MSASLLDDIQDAVAAYLRTQSALQGWEVVDHKVADVGSNVTQAIAKQGCYIVVHLPLPTMANPNVPGWADALELEIEVGNRPTVNTTGVRSGTIAQAIWAALTDWKPSIEGVQPFYPAPRVIERVPAETVDILIVTMRTAAGIQIN